MMDDVICEPTQCVCAGVGILPPSVDAKPFNKSMQQEECLLPIADSTPGAERNLPFMFSFTLLHSACSFTYLKGQNRNCTSFHVGKVIITPSTRKLHSRRQLNIIQHCQCRSNNLPL
ncbi:Hypothetical protein, putative [Bodo saltans]|uniref:Uncharacterized protein n=1 Tax=Bodo saltans TaxID=75058 RepID=A0A0S4IS45_BODSA|nr:Hypothetical protein, putative [Bodo saltans]|eukprot:CUF56606.1 Hypothetical protein, putative [Bodo saltans]